MARGPSGWHAWHFATLVLLVHGRGVQAADAVTVEFAPDVPAAAAARIASRVRAAAAPSLNLADGDTLARLSVGRTAACVPGVVSEHELDTLGAEGFILRGAVVDNLTNGTTVLACAVGNGEGGGSGEGAAAFRQSVGSTGSVYGAYAALEALGFAFMHPLEPVLPNPGSVSGGAAAAAWRQLNVTSRPRFPIRSWHVHTEHPLELLELLQGVDSAGVGGGVATEWADMVPEYELLLEWLVANGQNRLEWVILDSPDWAPGFVSSALRQGRLRQLTDLARAYGVRAGADVPIAEQQQHAWYMVQQTSSGTSPERQRQAIASRVDWMTLSCAAADNRTGACAGAGFDFIATESGLSEFTHPSDATMLRLINDLADYARSKRVPTYIKCHCSAGQTCTNATDPRTGQPLNFNFLPMLATPSMGVMPHTVQPYAFDDPAPTYGNANFRFMLDFLMYEAANSTREVVYHGETNYWVNVDIDVPLFLPLYGERRLRDLRTMAQREADLGLSRGRVGGQNNFDSGWEWGAWLSDVVTARAAWSPLLAEFPFAGGATSQARAFRAALAPLERALGGGALGAAVANATAALAAAQERLLIRGAVGNFTPDATQIAYLSGISFLSGEDAWTSLLELLRVANTQPKRIEPEQWLHKDYARVAPLLDAMHAEFGDAAATFAALRAEGGAHGAALAALPPAAASLLDDLADATAMLAVRAAFVRQLHRAASPANAALPPPARRAALALAQATLSRAAALVSQREARYRVPAERISAWRPNPTSYAYTYLWTVHSLYYWWRELGQVQARLGLASAGTGSGRRNASAGVLAARLSPCYLNMQSPLAVAFGPGTLLGRLGRHASDVREALLAWARMPNRTELAQHADFIGDCLAPPPRPYEFPRDLYRY